MTVAVTRNTDVDTELAACEAVIERGLKTFVEVGEALATIRNKGLYFQDHDTFEDYCRDRWNIGRRHAYELMDAAQIVHELSAIAHTPLPANEGQARELTGLKPEVAAEVMTKAHEDTGGKVTAAAITEAREQVAPKPPTVTPIGKVKPAPKPRQPFTQTAEEAKRIGDEVWSHDVAKCVWLLATFGMHPGQAAGHLTGWDPTQDIYAEPTNPARLRQAANYLLELADAWEAQP